MSFSMIGQLPAASWAAARAFRRALKPQAPKPEGLNLNVGSGGYVIPGFVDVDIPSDWYDWERKQGMVPYDMRSQNLPFGDSTVDNIYCSHVIEHIEDEYVERFLTDSARVLKDGGCLRIATPDAEFLWNVSSFDNDYWAWRKNTFRKTGIDPNDCDRYDYLIREISTRKVRHGHAEWNELHDSLEGLTFTEAMAKINAGDVFDIENIGTHINNWSFDKINAMSNGRFRHVIRSRWQGSVSRAMIGPIFDLKQPQMSLYVELIK
jgi:predicted SAM-dependent methyltransferase